MTSFETIVSNELDEIHMIAGDDKVFLYTVYDRENNLINLTGCSCYVYIFKYGDPSTVFCTLEGNVDFPETGQFTVTFGSASSINLSGVYQQQIKIVDYIGEVHIPAQGKIVIFPSPS